MLYWMQTHIVLLYLGTTDRLFFFFFFFMVMLSKPPIISFKKIPSHCAAIQLLLLRVYRFRDILISEVSWLFFFHMGTNGFQFQFPIYKSLSVLPRFVQVIIDMVSFGRKKSWKMFFFSIYIYRRYICVDLGGRHKDFFALSLFCNQGKQA